MVYSHHSVHFKANEEVIKDSPPTPPPDDVTDPTAVRIKIGRIAINAGLLSLVVLVLQNTLLVLLTRWTRANGLKTYRASTMVILAEVVKFVSCVAYAFYEERRRGNPFNLTHLIFTSEAVKLVLPAGLFTLQNYLLFISLSNLDAMTFQVLSQIKLLLAAIFSILLLNKYLSCIQWTSVLLLMLGIIVSSMGEKTRETVGGRETRNNTVGVLSCVISGVSSSFAGVYFEKILKGSPPSIAIRNIQLGAPAMVFSVLSMLCIDGLPGWDFTFFDGYSTVAVVLLFIQAGGGILVAIVVKYADNILKGFATGIAIVVSGVYTAWAWHFAPSPHFLAGSCLVIIGTVIYNLGYDDPALRRCARMLPGGHRIPPTPGTQPAPEPLDHDEVHP